MNFGITEKSMNFIIDALKHLDEVDKAVVFGSRAMGNYKNGSDIDLALYGCFITNNIVNSLSILLNEELPLPYYFDILHYEGIDNIELKKHIDIYGKVLYCK